jgi:three-Cys-motif partner protein
MTKKEKEIPKVGPWAEEKLDRLEKYLCAYTTILSKRRWAKTVYVDAFAAAGRARIRVAAPLLDLGDEFRKDDDARQLINGSPARALAVDPPFDHYVFIDRDPDRVAALEKLKAEHPGEGPTERIAVSVQS